MAKDHAQQHSNKGPAQKATNTEPPQSQQPPASETTTQPPAHDAETGETAPPPGSGGVEMLKKIVAKNVVGLKEMRLEKVVEKNEDGTDKKDANGNVIVTYNPKALYSIFGVARDTKSGNSNYGEWTSFLGTFEAVRRSDGKRFVSSVAFLQDPAEGLLMQQLAQVKRDDANGTVGFAFHIGIKISDRWLTTQQGSQYEYTIESIFNVTRHDPLADMRNQLAGQLPTARAALPAPPK